jgi:hypothetical protein
MDATTEQTDQDHKITIRNDFFVAFQCAPEAPLIRCARPDRKWMDETNQRFPYRCLPLVICNQFGYDVINPCSFVAYWNGGASPEDVKIAYPHSYKRSRLAQAHFGSGILTITLGHLFRTAPGINLYVKGPPNEPRDGIIALEGIVETDSSPATFTMNYLFTRKNHEVMFEAGESYCRFFPIPRMMTEVFSPEIRELEDDPELFQLYLNWGKKRQEFNKGLLIPGSEYVERRWQKDYFQGGGDLFPKFIEHQTKLKQSEFVDRRHSGTKSDILPDSNTRPMTVYGRDGKPLTLFVASAEKHHAKQERSFTYPTVSHRQEPQEGHGGAGDETDSIDHESPGAGGDNGAGSV